MREAEVWKAWLEQLANYCRMSTAMMIDQVLMEFAELKGFIETPAER